MKRRSFFYALAAIVLVLLLIGLSGFYWLTSRSPLNLMRGAPTASPAAAMFVPKQAPVLTSLLVNPDRLEAFRQVVARPSERRRSRAEINQLKQSLLADTDLDYKRDIQPWLGDEITLAVTTLDIDRDPSNGQQLGYLLAVATQDPERSREFLQLFWQKRALAGIDLVFEQYKGVKLISGKPARLQPSRRAKGQADPASPLAVGRSPNLASAVVGNQFVLFANDPKVLRDAINNVQAPDLNLATTETYQRAIQSLSNSHIGLAFLNLPTFSNLVGNSDTPQVYESEAIALKLTRQGLVADTALLAATDVEMVASNPGLNKPVAALQHLPAATAFAVSGNDLLDLVNTDLPQLWFQLSQGDDAIAQFVTHPLTALRERWGLELPPNAFDWVQDDYTLGLLPRQQASDWILVADKSGAEAESAINRLDAIAKEQGLSVGPLSLGNQPITTWTKLSTGPIRTNSQASGPMTLQAQVKGVHASVGNYEIFTTSVEAMDQALKAPQDSLADQKSFQQAIAPFNQPNTGYLYLNWPQSQPILERQFPLLRLIEVGGQPLFTHLRSLTISSYGAQEGVRRGALFVKLGEAKS